VAPFFLIYAFPQFQNHTCLAFLPISVSAFRIGIMNTLQALKKNVKPCLVDLREDTCGLDMLIFTFLVVLSKASSLV